MSGIKPGARVCVTGANGFIGSYIVRELLEAGFVVHGTVRDPGDQTKVAHLVEIAALMGKAESLELFAGDLAVRGSFDEALAGCEALIHAAASVAFASKNPQRDIVDPSVEGTRNVLASAKKAGVKRVVHTSSMAACYGFDDDQLLTEDSWNTDATLKSDPYALAKVSAERVALEFVRALPEAERFELVHLHPGMVWGPPMTKAHSKATPRIVRDIISRGQPGLPKLMLSIVDVREVARAHLLALTLDAPPPRCLLAAEDLWLPEAAARLQALFPKTKMVTRTIPKPLVIAAAMMDKALHARQLSKLIGLTIRTDTRLSREAYELEYRSVDQTLEDTASVLMKNGWARAS